LVVGEENGLNREDMARRTIQLACGKSPNYTPGSLSANPTIDLSHC